ncbi:hypothetical protein [Longimycelium tulufanense]|uniref:hypothetical protein n=1 Tax=Longimycelium tulufanense TaxID=907463 RepID=UPI001E60B779|nr:hypothetical protein [Longimycelium tulufanense]
MRNATDALIARGCVPSTPVVGPGGFGDKNAAEPAGRMCGETGVKELGAGL